MSEKFDLSAGILVLKLIILFMAIGNALFLAVAIFVAPLEGVDPQLSRVLFPVLLGMAVLAVLVPPVVYRMLLGSARARIGPVIDQDPATVALPYWQKLVLIRGAVAEALGLFATVVFLLTQSWPALVITVAAILLLVARMPTRAGLDRFVAASTPAGV